jgi:protein-disulfide isomerase
MVCAEIGAHSGVCELVMQQAKQLAPDRCRQMLEQKTQTLADLRQMEDSRLPLDPSRWASLTQPDAPSLGPATAKVTVVAFVDFQCPECLEAAAYVPRLPESFPGQVRVVVHQSPSSRPVSNLAAEASLEAHAQGKFWEYYERLYNNQHDMSRATLVRCAKEVGLEAAPFDRVLNDRRYAAAVERDRDLARNVLAGPAPYFFVNGTRVAGRSGAAALKEAVEHARAAK